MKKQHWMATLTSTNNELKKWYQQLLRFHQLLVENNESTRVTAHTQTCFERF